MIQEKILAQVKSVHTIMMNDANKNVQLIHNNNKKNDMHFLTTIKPHPLKYMILLYNSTIRAYKSISIVSKDGQEFFGLKTG